MDHGQARSSNDNLLANHGQFIEDHGQQVVDHGQPRSILFDHGQDWLTMLISFDHGQIHG